MQTSLAEAGFRSFVSREWGPAGRPVLSFRAFPVEILPKESRKEEKIIKTVA
jgi:hypothetical protein